MRTEQIPALCAVIAGVLIAALSGTVCRKAQHVPQVRNLGIAIALIGALLWLLP